MKTRTVNTPGDWQALEYHPLSELTDFGAGVDVEALAAFMREYGYDPDERIVLYDGRILDGRHRHKAASLAGVVPTFCEFVGADALAYVLKKMFRQHLDTSQRAMMAARYANLPAHRPKKDSEGGEITPQYCGVKTGEAAEKFQVSARSIVNAREVIESGTEKLQDAVKAGDISVSDAAKVASRPKPVQDQAVDAVKAGGARTAAQASGWCERCRRIGAPSCDDCRGKAGKKPKPAPEAAPEPKPDAKEKTVAELFAGVERVLGRWRDQLGAGRVRRADELVNAAFQEITLLQGELAGMTSAQTQQALFANFWAAYPKKTQKEDALKAWKKLEPSAELVATMLAAVAAQGRTEQWQREGGQFIPYPATWINGRRWEDELPEAPKSLREIAAELEEQMRAEKPR